MRVELLGPLRVTRDDGDDVPLGPSKQRAVFALLALRASSVVSTAELMTALWGEDMPATAAKTLQIYVSGLRKSLPVGLIETTARGYRLRLSADEVDASRFEKQVGDAARALRSGDAGGARALLAESLGWWRGDPLVDLADRPLGVAEVARLEELRRGAQEDFFEARLALAEHHGLVGDLEAAVAAEPLRERRWAQLMVALYRCGRQSDALRAYQRLRAVLAEGVGLEPTADLRTLEGAILAQDPALNLTSRRSDPEPTNEGLPSGDVTFVSTDVEGSTGLLQSLRTRFRGLLEEQRRVIHGAMAAHGGTETSSGSDGSLFVFTEAAQAAAACIDAQRALAAHPWPYDAVVRVRMGLHTGVAAPTPDGGYLAKAVHQAARIGEAAHGGQVLVSAPTAGLLKNALPLGTAAVERGRYLLKDFDEPQHLYQLTHPDLHSDFPPLRATPAIPHHLPDARTSFIGRSKDLGALDDLVMACRLVTVVGPGGAGKTRLCLELAARLAPRFEAGAQLADLSPVSDPLRVEVTIASLYEVRESADGDIMLAVGRELAGQKALLVLDNCEHVLEAASDAVERLLATAPGLRVLATSRQPLGVKGEQRWRITPLAVPSPNGSVEEIRQNESVHLFEDRARLALPSFTVNEQNAAAVAAICLHLEGLPLAVELTAARVATMSTTTIATRLDSLSEAATSSSRTKDHHRSLDATIDWSYQLLDDSDRRLLRSLSIFAGGFTMEAVESVAATERPLAGLASLVDKSLVVYAAAADADRYRLLEPVRTFALSRLHQAGETESVARQHLRWSAAFAETVYESAPTAREALALAATEREIGNIRAAVAWAEEHAELDGLRLIGRLFWYWYFRAPVEGRSWAERMLATVPVTDPVATGMVLTAQSACAKNMGDMPAALAASAAALAMLRDAGNETALFYATMIRAVATTQLPDRTESSGLYLEASALASRTGRSSWEAGVFSNLSTIERHEGNYMASVEYAERALNSARSGDCPASLHALIRVNLGRSKLRLGASVAEVRPTFVEAFEWATQTRSPMLVALALESLAETVASGDSDGAARLMGAAAGVLRSHGQRLDEPDQAHHDFVLHAIESRLGQPRANQLMEAVFDLSLDQAMLLGRAFTQ